MTEFFIVTNRLTKIYVDENNYKYIKIYTIMYVLKKELK